MAMSRQAGCDLTTHISIQTSVSPPTDRLLKESVSLMSRAVSQAEGALMLDSTHRNIWRKQLRAKELMGDFEYFKDVDLLKLLAFILRPFKSLM